MKTITVIDSNNNQFTFYDNQNGIIIRELEGFEYADVNAVIDDISGDVGAIYITSKFGRRSFSWAGDLVSDNVFALRRQMLAVLRQTGVMKTIKFTTYDGLDLQAEAEIVKVLNPYNHKIHTYLIEAISPDWRFYSQTLKEFETVQTVISGGASIPATIPMSFHAENNSSNVASNDGNEITDPVFVIHGPGTQFTVGNQTTGKEFIIEYSLNSTQYIEVDVKNRSVKLNGLTNIYSSFDGDFWRLEPGGNTVRFIVEGVGENSLLTIRYRDAYNGL